MRALLRLSLSFDNLVATNLDAGKSCAGCRCQNRVLVEETTGDHLHYGEPGCRYSDAEKEEEEEDGEQSGADGSCPCP